MGTAAYAEAIRQFVPAMKKIDPSIKIAVCGSDSFDIDWNRRMLSECPELFDYLSIHYYENPDRFADGPSKYEQFFRETGEAITKSANPNIKIFCSEWNAMSSDWRTGLYAGGLLNAFERCSDFFGMGSPALFMRHTSAPGWDNAFINFDHRKWFPAPNYVVMKLWRDHYAPNRIVIDGDTDQLNAVATKSKDGKTLYFKVVNPTDTNVDVKLNIEGGFATGKAQMEIIAPGSLQAHNSLDQPGLVHPVAGKLVEDGRNISFTLPSYSAAVVTIPR